MDNRKNCVVSLVTLLTIIRSEIRATTSHDALHSLGNGMRVYEIVPKLQMPVCR